MRFFNVVFALVLTNVISAWKIPQGTTDGVYKVDTLADGSTVHTKLIAAADIDHSLPEAKDAISLIPERSLSSLEKRFYGQIWCGCGFNMVPGDCDAAVADLKSQLRPTFINSGQAYYSIRGRVVAFACNYGSSTWLISGGNLGDSLAEITNSCGRYIAGARQTGDDGQALIMGYQRWGGNDDFCGNARSSPANHC